MRPLRMIAAALLLLSSGLVGAHAQTVGTTSYYTLTVTISPAISAVLLSNTTNGLGTISGVNNIPSGTLVGSISLAPAGIPYPGPVILGGAGASHFALTNGGMFPTNLVTSGVLSASATYQISLSVTPP